MVFRLHQLLKGRDKKSQIFENFMTHNDEYLTPFTSDFGDDDLGEGDDDIKTPVPEEDGDEDDNIKPPVPETDDSEENLGTEEY